MELIVYHQFACINKMNVYTLWAIITALLLIMPSCKSKSLKPIIDNFVTDSLSKIDSIRDTAEISSTTKQDSENKEYLKYSVFDIEQNKWLADFWFISKSAYTITGYKEYNRLHPYMVMGALRYSNKDTLNRYCWVLTIGYGDDEREAMREAYLIPNYEKHLMHNYYVVNIDTIEDVNFGLRDTIHTSEFVLRDTIILYKFANEKSIFCNENEISNGVFLGGEFVVPCSEFDFFYIGKPKYKLVLK
jgi:hypothetical protein